jgi:hypothetical protein
MFSCCARKLCALRSSAANAQAAVVLPAAVLPAAVLPAAADPLYFDFISFSQYATISREMAQPARVFEEYYEICPPGVGDDEPCEVRWLGQTLCGGIVKQG